MTVNMDQFRDSEGHVDWAAYQKAQVEAGEVCRECGAYILFSKGKASLCVPCNVMHQDKGEVSHEKRVRCPHCTHIFHLDTGDSDNYDLLSDGEHSMTCPGCEREFTIQTTVAYHFSSPALDAGLPEV